MLSLAEVTRWSERDRFRLWPVCAALVASMLLQALYAFWEGADVEALIVVASLVWYGSAVLVALWLPFLVAQGQYRRAVSFAALPVIASLPLWWPTPLTAVYRESLYVRFLMHRAEYQAAIAQIEARGGAPVIACFPWWSYGFPGAAGEIAVVYDASDEIALPVGQQSPAWWHRTCSDLRSDASDNATLPFTARHLGGHYYLIDISLEPRPTTEPRTP